MTRVFLFLVLVLFISGQCARVGGEFREFAWCTLAACAFLALAGLSVLGGA